MRFRFVSVVLALGAGVLALSTSAVADKPDIDPTYADGQTVYMIGAHLIPNARETQPNLYAHAQELYLVTYQTDPSHAGPPITVGGGYQPQCNPCFHPGLPIPFVYHDHVITGLPGQGTNGTAGEYKAPWKIIVLQYDPAWSSSPNFVPVKSETQIDEAELAGKFLPINHGEGNPFEIDTGNVLICPTVSSHA